MKLFTQAEASEVQELAESQSMTYQPVPSDIAAMTKIGAHGLSPQNCERELRVLFGVNLKAPRPTSIRLPVLRKSSADGYHRLKTSMCLGHMTGSQPLPNKVYWTNCLAQRHKYRIFGTKFRMMTPSSTRIQFAKFVTGETVLCDRVPWRCCTTPKE